MEMRCRGPVRDPFSGPSLGARVLLTELTKRALTTMFREPPPLPKQMYVMYIMYKPHCTNLTLRRENSRLRTRRALLQPQSPGHHGHGVRPLAGLLRAEAPIASALDESQRVGGSYVSRCPVAGGYVAE